ncbi:MAG: hypothetical protein ACREWG_16380 [Gammaproteobacteria bacterium]
MNPKNGTGQLIAESYGEPFIVIMTNTIGLTIAYNIAIIGKCDRASYKTKMNDVMQNIIIPAFLATV